MLPPTILLDATDDMLVCRKEVFGPVVAIAPFSDPEQPFWTVHDLDYGMRTSLFTNDLALVLRSFDALDVGTVTVNTSPLFRAESVDHGGRKRSSLGYESVDAAIAMMTEEKVLYMEMHR
jgi:acyl-CoA reductase-like NAD-dependent aldehyde dehydrogenase